MHYRLLGRTGLRVSELCLGTMTFGSNFFNIGAVDQAGANRMTGRALEAGINFFDTADVYSYGESEQILGRAIEECGAARDSVVVATKVFSPLRKEDPIGSGLSRQHIMRGCEASLRRLGMDYIDLYQVHAFDPLTPVEETVRAIEDLILQGKVIYAGCSNWPARHLMKAVDTFVSL